MDDVNRRNAFVNGSGSNGLSILGRLNANAKKDHMFQINDLVEIMNNLGNPASSEG